MFACFWRSEDWTICWFPDVEVPLVIIHSNGIFPEKRYKATILDTPIYGNPHLQNHDRYHLRISAPGVPLPENPVSARRLCLAGGSNAWKFWTWYGYICGAFHKWGVPLVIILILVGFSLLNYQTSILGYLHFRKPPYIYIYMVFFDVFRNNIYEKKVPYLEKSKHRTRDTTLFVPESSACTTVNRTFACTIIFIQYTWKQISP